MQLLSIICLFFLDCISFDADFLILFSVEATRWKHVQVGGVPGVSVPDAAGPLPPQQLGVSICKSACVHSCISLAVFFCSKTQQCGFEFELYLICVVMLLALWRATTEHFKISAKVS